MQIDKEIYKKSISDRVDWILNLSNEHSRTYCAPEAFLSRRRYLTKHPTSVIALKCMDGRIHIPVATNTPLGIIKPFRNIGGMFDLGWPYLGEILSADVMHALDTNRRVLILITYHYSKSDHHKGCAGFGYDCEAAKKHVFEVKKQVEYIFGSNHQSVYPVVVGFETDEDAMIFHGEDKTVMNMAEFNEADRDSLYNRLQAMYPDMPERIVTDLLPLAFGNIEHIKEVRASNRDLNLDVIHKEWIICVGRGFDFLHVPNTALIIGPYSPDLSSPIATAASIIKSNMNNGSIPNDGFLLLSSAPYKEYGPDKARAELKAKFLGEYASKVIAKEHPDLHGKMIMKSAVLNWMNRKLDVLDLG